jgi:hypothetical protein
MLKNCRELLSGALRERLIRQRTSTTEQYVVCKWRLLEIIAAWLDDLHCVAKKTRSSGRTYYSQGISSEANPMQTCQGPQKLLRIVASCGDKIFWTLPLQMFGVVHFNVLKFTRERTTSPTKTCDNPGRMRSYICKEQARCSM